MILKQRRVLWPAEIYSMDSYKFGGKAAHPSHGQPFRPEIIVVIDVATRKLVGWSVTLAESSLAMLDALRHSVECGIPAILYVDNGAGHVNALMEDPLAGFMARLGITKQHSLPNHSQSQSAVERLHCAIWTRLTKEFATPIGAILPSWPEFLARCEAAVADYNNRPHSSLPKITDAETGKVRRQTPSESWAELATTHPECIVATATAVQGEPS